MQSKSKIDEQIVDIWRILRFVRGSIRTIRENAEKFTEYAKSEPKVFM